MSVALERHSFGSEIVAGYDGEQRRRRELRGFLMARRARLAPADVGLPVTARRRVDGLRRDEVAELIGVSVDWYRWFESGRDVRVSPKMVARLASALRLTADEKLTMYSLALPEMYQAQSALNGIFAANRSAIDPAASRDLEQFVREVDDARRRFLSGAKYRELAVRLRILRSWKRCTEMDVDPDGCIAHPVQKRVEDIRSRAQTAALSDAAQDVIVDLHRALSQKEYIVVLADDCGLLRQLTTEGDALSQASGLCIGADLSECSAGTNAIGTALADARPVQVVATEHFCRAWHGSVGAAAPVRDPHGTIAGALGILAPYGMLSPQLFRYTIECALEIEEKLAVR